MITNKLLHLVFALICASQVALNAATPTIKVSDDKLDQIASLLKEMREDVGCIKNFVVKLEKELTDDSDDTQTYEQLDKNLRAQ